MVNVDSNNVGSYEGQRTSDHDLKKIIAGGKAKMPPVRSVTGKSIDSICRLCWDTQTVDAARLIGPAHFAYRSPHREVERA